MSAKPRVKAKESGKPIAARSGKSTAKKSASGTTAKAAAKASARAQGATISSYVKKLEPWQSSLVRAACALIESSAPKMTGSIKWGQPVFEQGGPVCYVKAFRSAVNFGFWRGVELKDPKRLLEGSGEKMRHIKLTRGAVLNATDVAPLIKQAVKLNATLGDPTKVKSS